MQDLYIEPDFPFNFSSIIWRNKFKGVFLAIAAIGTAILITAFSTPSYRSEARLFVRIGRESVSLDPTVTTGQFLQMSETRENEMNSFVELLVSHAVLAKVIETVGADEILGKPGLTAKIGESLEPLNQYSLNPFQVHNRAEKAEAKLRQKLKVRSAKNSNVVTLTYEADSAEFAKRMLESLIRVASDEHMRIHRVEGSRRFFEDQVRTQGEKVETISKSLQNAKSQTGIASVEIQREIILKQIGNFEDDLAKATALAKSVKGEIDARNLAMESIPVTIESAVVSGSPNNPEDGMRQQLFALEIREKELAATRKEGNLELERVREQIRQARSVFNGEERKKQVTVAVNPARETALAALREKESQLFGIERQMQSLNEHLESLRAKMASLNKDEIKIRSLTRELEVAEKSYRQYMENLEFTRIDQQLQDERISNISPLQEPTAPETPASPSIRVNLALGAVLGCMLAMGAAAWSEKRRERRLASRDRSELETSATNQKRQLVANGARRRAVEIVDEAEHMEVEELSGLNR